MKRILNSCNISKGSENRPREYVFRWVKVGHEFIGLTAALPQHGLEK